MKTYKQRLNVELGFDEDQEHTLQELKDTTGIPVKILKEVDKRGKGAYKSNLGSLRLKEDFSKNPDLRKGASKRLSAKQWGRARSTLFSIKLYSKKCDTKNKAQTYTKK